MNKEKSPIGNFSSTRCIWLCSQARRRGMVKYDILQSFKEIRSAMRANAMMNCGGIMDCCRYEIFHYSILFCHFPKHWKEILYFWIAWLHWQIIALLCMHDFSTVVVAIIRTHKLPGCQFLPPQTLWLLMHYLVIKVRRVMRPSYVREHVMFLLRFENIGCFYVSLT